MFCYSADWPSEGGHQAYFFSSSDRLKYKFSQIKKEK
jgi:hypothetical protein